MQSVVDTFWRHWSQLAGPNLFLRTKWHTMHRNVAIGDIVWIANFLLSILLLYIILIHTQPSFFNSLKVRFKPNLQDSMQFHSWFLCVMPYLIWARPYMSWLMFLFLLRISIPLHNCPSFKVIGLLRRKLSCMDYLLFMSFLLPDISIDSYRMNKTAKRVFQYLLCCADERKTYKFGNT